ncbi:MAG: type I-C CRISPR-associated protein Cas5 [Phycisphaerales bacterium]|nr:type I-C CRISPR-associated protein Cas5 [Phycisphaerales bacterium]
MPYGISLHVSGEFALFTRPEMKVERVTYDVITPSAARGLIEAVYWKPEIRWRITRLHVLNPIRFMSLRRNEVASKVTVKGPTGVAAVMKSGHGSLGICVDAHNERVQRAATVLRDVAYVIDAEFDIVGGENNAGKHLDQFNRRAREGQCFHRPYLGCREFPADFRLLEPGENPACHPELRGECDLGWMLHDIVYMPDPKGAIVEGHGGQRVRAEPKFFRPIMVDGVIRVPPLDATGGAA